MRRHRAAEVQAAASRAMARGAADSGAGKRCSRQRRQPQLPQS